jgi:uncharacterized membrane protein YfcA
MLLPVLAYAFGPKEAVPIMALAGVLANLARILAWWREIDWRACAAYSVTGIPAAAFGARTLVELPARAVDICIGLFFLVMIPGRRWLAARKLTITLWHLALAGLVVGYLTGIVVSTGLITVPIFLAYGLVKGAFIATEAAGSIAVSTSKALAFHSFGILPLEIALKGLLAGGALMAGTFAAKPLMLRLDPETFRRIMDVMMLLSGAAMLWNAMSY